MSNMLRSKGKSVTRFRKWESDTQARLRRGLRNKHADDATAPAPRDGDAFDLARLFATDPELMLRQMISVLDKTVGKRRSIRRMNPQAYVDRDLLGRALWKRLEPVIEASAQGAEARRLRDDLGKSWAWRVHPYSGYRIGAAGVSPDQDENYARILSSDDREMDRSAMNGRWHNEFWVLNDARRPDHGAIAALMWQHLTENEFKLKSTRDGKSDHREARDDSFIRGLKQRGTPSGLAGARGERIAESVRDPRFPRPDAHYRTTEWGKAEIETYFRKDVAAEILGVVISGANEPFRASRFGQLLYAHFKGPLDAVGDKSKEERRPLWSLHNHIRAFYNDTGKSQRFVIADRADGTRTLYVDDLTPGEADHLAHLGFPESKNEKGKAVIELPERAWQMITLLPHDKAGLLRAIEAKKRNGSVGELIRLGKIIVHASDLPRDTATDQINVLFQERMNHFAESEGQAEIKRNEAFARVWRNAVALSQRTLRLWVEADPEKDIHARTPRGEIDRDLSTKGVSIAALSGQFGNLHYGQQLNILFGNKEWGEDRVSRASLMGSVDEAENKEMLWTMLRIAAELRNRANHFCTKRRIVDLLSDGIVRPLSKDRLPEKLDDRGQDEVKDTTIGRLDRLLSFDRSLDTTLLVEELRAARFHTFVADPDRKKILQEICAEPGAAASFYPRFKSVVHHAQNLAKSDNATPERRDSALVLLDLSVREATRPGANRFRIDVLRKLYTNGFRAWIDEGAPGLSSSDQSDLSSIDDVVRYTAAEIKRRAEVELEQRDLAHAHLDTVLDRVGVSDAADLFDLMSQLASATSAQERIRKTYRADPKLQARAANDVERFRHEVFMQLFERYLKVKGLDFLWDAHDDAPEENATEVSAQEVRSVGEWDGADWHSQFYAWLYLVPIEDVSLLRHQFLKTEALENKSDGEGDPAEQKILRDLDRLMALYGRVNTAGFRGDEHEAKLVGAMPFFENPEKFELVQSADPETQELSLRGTRRGLRQILRFGHTNVMESIIKRHQVTGAEVEYLLDEQKELEVGSTQLKKQSEKRVALHKAIVEVSKSREDLDDETRNKLQDACALYRDLVTESKIHDYGVHAARLTEFSRLHQLMMRIVGRLNDYAGLWERDMTYLFLGLAYRQYAASRQPGLTRREPAQDAKDESGNQLELTLPGADRALRLWDERRGFNLEKFKDVAGILSPENRKLHDRYYKGFVDGDKKDGDFSPRNRDADRIAIRKKLNPRGPQTWHQHGYDQIRNDFAHYNVLTTKGRRPNLTYQMNAIRSLFGYDRKLKNAVSKSIRRIVAEAGVDIGWTMEEDRLMKARTMPTFETHLTMVPERMASDVQFCVPRASVRFTSMVRALFDHDKGGNRKPENIVKSGKAQRRNAGILSYPRDLNAAAPAVVPGPIRELSYRKLPSESR